MSHVAKFDLTLGLGERRGPGGEPLGIEGGLEYSRDLFEEATAEAIAARLVRLLEAAVASPDLPAAPAGDPRCRRAADAAGGFQRHGAGRCPRRTLPELFEAQVARTPEAVAVVCESESLSYGELNARANRLAHHLIGLGVGPEAARGGLPGTLARDGCGPILAILKAGGAYVPLDPDYPRERLTHLLEDAEVSRARVSGEPVAATCPSGERRRCAFRIRTKRSVPRALRAIPTRRRGGTHTAYSCYTSGSTGRPKGVVVEHRQLVRYVQAALERTALPAPVQGGHAVAFDG